MMVHPGPEGAYRGCIWGTSIWVASGGASIWCCILDAPLSEQPLGGGCTSIFFCILDAVKIVYCTTNMRTFIVTIIRNGMCRKAS